MKQHHNYNIITYRPKQHNQHIKKYPKLSLEERDQNLRLRYLSYSNSKGNQIENNPEYEEKNNMNESNRNQKIAGKYTYRIDHIKGGKSHRNEK